MGQNYISTKGRESTIEQTILAGKRLIGKKKYLLDDRDIKTINELISIYDNGFYEYNLRKQAVDIVCDLAKSHDQTIDLIIQSTKMYTEILLEKGADPPYKPNSFDILKEIGLSLALPVLDFSG